MKLFPAIDLKNGQCVRLFKGEMDQAVVYNDHPAQQAGAFRDAGAEWLHIVDLDGAFAGKSENGSAVEAILSEVSLPIQLGGGIRTLGAISAWLEKGIQRVILGTVALTHPDLVKQACREFSGHIAVGLDARNGYVAVEGWAETSTLSAVEVAQRFEDCGVSAVIFTDIERDGTNTGVNIEATDALARQVSLPIIASGGVSDLQNLKDLKARNNAGIAGAIIGKALYDGRIDLSTAISVMKED